MFILLLCAVPVALAQSGDGSWQSRHQTVRELVRGITVDGHPYVTTSDTYNPENRIIHDDDAEIDYPVDLPETQWRERLDEEEFYVLRQEGTEPAFSNRLYDEEREGIYYSRATGQPLFHSRDKYESGTGWPSFRKPISPDAVAYMWDTSLFTRRIEIIDSLSGSHIGHVFDDGPAPTGKRYCMNSAALVFVPTGEEPPQMLTPDSM